MDFVLFMIGISSLIINVKGQSCYYDYHHCTGYDWCCPDSYVCTGSSTCLSIRAIVGICIGGLFGLAIFIACIYYSCKKEKGRVGTVLTHPDVNTHSSWTTPVWGASLWTTACIRSNAVQSFKRVCAASL
ncbi:uncharacterized protein LOC134709829 [Mytilus trossulus]|uniref:uncharacterized protein LOC134709829 n=1 Tax=Mytilus trossulus TaxID=6551 RepID=UPI003003BC15